jgi:holliday junction DNA helicase RuvA
MIGSLRGTIVEEHEDGAFTVDVAGVGYEVHAPLGTRGRLGEGAVTLSIHTHVREDAITLFGFASPDDRRIFRMLLGVTGIGPKVALAILGRLDAHELATAVARQDQAAFKGITGVGKKLVERLLLDLRDKPLSAGAPPPPRAVEEAPRPGDTPSAVVSALVNMGYKRAEVERAVALLEPREDATLESLLRDTLAALR